ncbi:MAG TPA: SGNH/GDSL hydrolase family protein, partial [Chitinispirillaceae bacterium]|nr:SGNH/GDSL hydrolase family protein [Chitinispirillaceae bacterium]
MVKQRTKQRVFAVFMLFWPFLSVARADVLIPASDPNINYYGRFDWSDPEKPVFNWSGNIIEANFPGPLIGMKLTHEDGYYDIEIDGEVVSVINCGNKSDHIFTTNLTPSIHTLRVILRSEGHWSTAVFEGLYLENGKALAPPPVEPSRKIEFIGDSFSAGYGIESSSRSCSSTDLQKYTNTNKAFPMLITKAFHAQATVLAWSGAGMIRNYGDSKKRSDEPFPYYYDRTLADASDARWDYSKWIPDLVVICLGTNDFSTTPHPDDSMYIGDYHKMITRIISNYPQAKICCVGTTETIIQKLVKQVVTEENDQYIHPQVFYAEFPPSIEYTACDWHPSITDNKAITNNILKSIMTEMNWDTAATTTIINRFNLNTC